MAQAIRFKAPKTDRTRAITVPAFAVEELRRLKREQAEELLRAGIRQSADTLVICWENGEPKWPSSLTYDFTRLIGGLPDLPTRPGLLKAFHYTERATVEIDVTPAERKDFASPPHSRQTHRLRSWDAPLQATA